MTTIKATCPMCGDVDLTPAQVRLTVAQAAGWATYTFTCGTCHDLIEGRRRRGRGVAVQRRGLR